MKASFSPIPVFCYGFISLLIAIYTAEGIQSVNLGASFSNIKYDILVTLGGISAELVIQKDDYSRLFAAPLLHASLEHLFFNCLAIIFVGTILERIIGAAFTAGIFTTSALFGGAFSILINPPTLLSVGASGGILGLVAALGVVSLKVRHAPMRKKLSNLFYDYLLPSLLPVAGSSLDSKIDIACHAGGAVGGAISTYMLIMLFPTKNTHAKMDYALICFFCLFSLVGVIKIIGIQHLHQ